MLTVVVIGTGNLAQQLVKDWKDHDQIRVLGVAGRTGKRRPALKGLKVTPLDAIESGADIYIIAVNDSAITTVSQNIKHVDGLVVHTAGSMAIDALNSHERRGVFYPLQTFSTLRDIDFSEVPFFLEVNNEEDQDTLTRLAMSLSKNVNWLSSPKRKKLHLAAVFLNNFTNHLLYQSGTLCEAMDLDREVLYPLLRETLEKAIALGAYDAQTGPARRGDSEVIQAHLEMIHDPLQKQIYQVISDSIQTTYEN